SARVCPTDMSLSILIAPVNRMRPMIVSPASVVVRVGEGPDRVRAPRTAWPTQAMRQPGQGDRTSASVQRWNGGEGERDWVPISLHFPSGTGRFVVKAWSSFQGRTRSERETAQRVDARLAP